eukprot:g25556.t1
MAELGPQKIELDIESRELQGPQAENEVLFFQLVSSFTGTLQQARGRDVGQGTGWEEVNGQVLHLRWLQGKVLWGCGGGVGVKEEWIRVSQTEWSLRKVDKEGEGNMCLVVAEMVSDDLLDVGAGMI